MFYTGLISDLISDLTKYIIIYIALILKSDKEIKMNEQRLIILLILSQIYKNRKSKGKI